MHKEILTETQSKLLPVKTKTMKHKVIDTTLVNKKGKPDLLTLAAMKAFALGRRGKWKDYVDLYFILKAHHTVSEITAKGREVFGHEFNEKIFRTQLAYFEDIDYSEQISYKDGFSIADEIIKQALVEFSLADIV